MGCEGGGQPGVERVGEGVLPQVDVAGVRDLVDEGVFLGEAAVVVRIAVVVLALHSAFAGGAVDQAAEDVRVAGALPGSFAVGSLPTPAEESLRFFEGRVVDERWVGVSRPGFASG